MDKIFKLGLLAIGVVFLYLYNINLQNGRYQVDVFDDRVTVLDTWTSEYYVTDGEKRHIINPITRTRKWEYYDKRLQPESQTPDGSKFDEINAELKSETQSNDSKRVDEINAELKKVKSQFKQFQIWMMRKMETLKG